MNTAIDHRPLFLQADLFSQLQSSSPATLDHTEFGIIGFDAQGIVRLYNESESRMAGLTPGRVLGQALFTMVAPCMNNFLVAQRFDDAAAANEPLDAVVDYVLTLRMRPVKVKLRLLSQPGVDMRYVLVDRRV